jgi:hypothetical protein
VTQSLRQDTVSYSDLEATERYINILAASHTEGKQRLVISTPNIILRRPMSEEDVYRKTSA